MANLKTSDHSQAWVMRAKAAGVPECRDCREPVMTMGDWNKRPDGARVPTRCGYCTQIDERFRDNLYWDEQRARLSSRYYE